MKTTELNWYTVSEAIPKPNYPVLIRLLDNPSSLFRAVRYDYPPARYGFLFVLTNEISTTDFDAKLNEQESFCPASIMEWAYLVG